MTYRAVMSELRKMGTTQNVKIYKRHGAGDNLFGVSFANLHSLQEKIKTDHELALQLWASANVDARSLAILIADPNKMKPSEAEAWVGDIGYYLLADLLAGLVAKTLFASKKMELWMKSKNEFIRQCGYTTLAALLKDNADVPDESCRTYLRAIEQEIHGSANRARHAMNMALIAIGIYRRNLTEETLAAAARIGPVVVDHGETSCKTPDAISYIKKTLARPVKRKAAK